MTEVVFKSSQTRSGAALRPAGTRWATVPRHADLAIHAVLFVVLVWWSWRKWPDPLIDFGRELYIPWQITRGKLLYRDIASLFGPLSPYVNALWFRLFGVSLLTLSACNMAILAATVLGIHRLVRLSTDRLTANVASLTTLLVFGFSQYLDVGNYNFVSPYSHEATHGLALSVGLFTAVQVANERRSRIFWTIGGVCLGFTFLTKPEIFLAGAAAAVAGIGTLILRSQNRRDLSSHVSTFLVSAGIPPLGFFLYFVGHMPAFDALEATCGAWVKLFGTGIPSSAFYLRYMGLTNPTANLASMLLASVGFLLFSLAVIAISSAPTGRATVLREIARFTLVAIAIVVATQRAFGRILPSATLIVLGAVFVLFWRTPADREESRRFLTLLMWSIFALVLLAKKGLNPSIDHYGFYLALPATTVVIVLVCWLIPHLVARWKSAESARGFREIALCVVVATTIPFLALSQQWYRAKTLAIGAGADRFYALADPVSWHGAAVQGTYEALKRLAAPGMTLAVLPEGVMLNYLLRLDSPLRVVNFMPPELMAFGEEEVLRSLSAEPPDFIVLVHRDTNEYRYPLFGTDPRYGQRTRNWIDDRYQLLLTVGQEPRTVSGFGMEILKSRSTSGGDGSLPHR